MTTPAAPARRGSRFRAATPSESPPTPIQAPASTPTQGSPMAANCPHCSKPIESLSGFVPQDEHQRRINEKQSRVTALEQEVATLTPKAQGYDATTAELTRARGELAIAQENLTLAPRGYDARALAGLRAVHAAEMAAVEESKRTPFAGWLDGEGKEHPVVAAYAAKVSAPAAAAPAVVAPAPGANPAAPPNPAAPAQVAAPAVPAPVPAPAAPAVNQLPGVNNGTVTPPVSQVRMTPAQLDAYFASAEFKALPKDQRDAKFRELNAQYKAQPTTPAAA
jgi:hypothetical protein